MNRPAAKRDVLWVHGVLTDTELEHAHAIIHEPKTLMRAHLMPPMRFVKLAGSSSIRPKDKI